VSQFRGIRVRVQNASVTVRQILKANGTIGGTGGFGAAEVLSWSGGGAGVYVADNGTQLEFYRTAGPIPSVGTVISGVSDGTVPTFTVESYPAENLSVTQPVASYPAYFSTTGGTQGAINAGDTFKVAGDDSAGVVAATNMGADSFELTAGWAGVTATNVEAVVNRDKTDNFAWDLVEQGSRIPFAILKGTIRAIDAQVALGGGGGGTPPLSFTTFTLAANWANVGGVWAPAAYAYAAADDAVILKGYVNRTGAATNGEPIVAAGGLASGRRPAERLLFSFEGERYAIRTDGSITWEGVTGGTPGPISFSGVTFRADAP
jgi:hypothetical protein